MARTFLTCGLISMLAVPAFAQGETSSWVSGDTAAPAARGGAAKILKATPVQVPARPTLPPVGSGVITTKSQPLPVPTLPSSVPKGDTSVAKNGSGSDPAYEAFDQGRYLTALELAKAASERGEPQGATLIGRLYQEGLGVPRDDVQAAQWYPGEL